MKRKKNLLVNKYEIFTNEELKKVAYKYDAQVLTKVGIRDIVEIENSGITDDEYEYALKAHFDFVVTTGRHLSTEFVIEFDEESHRRYQKSIRNDKLKNSICKKFEIPIFRITSDFLKEIGQLQKFNSRSIFAGRFDSLAGWLVETWFLEKAFYEAQDKGLVPFDEPFCWFSFIDQDPFAQSRLYLHDLYKQKFCITYLPKIIKGHDIDEFAWGCLAILPLNNGRYVFGFAECKSINFSAISAYDLCEELAINDIVNQFIKHQDRELMGLAKQEMKNKEEKFKNQYIIPNYLQSLDN
ncbi:hypothetical protein NIES25_15740 [Nostoc linckia NIES-25]|nr:hypothetical protein NIES25_15740 [Nostoc linckia NIES-25]